MQGQQSGGWISYAIPFVVIAIVMALRWRRMSRVTPLKLERLWMLPAVYLILIGVTFGAHPPHGAAWLFCIGALGLGAALGWQRGKMMRITLDSETHTLNQTASPAAILFIIALVALRSGARQAAMMGGPAGLDPMAITDVLMALALGLFTAQRAEMYLRGKRMLAQATAPASAARVS